MANIPDELVYAFGQRRAVFFVAAGCSIPSGVPSANQLADRIAGAAWATAQNATSFTTFKEREFGTADPPLDAIAERFLQTDASLNRFVDLLAEAQWSRPPNSAHQGMIRLAMEGFFDAVLTTNWDELIEAECHNASCSFARVRKVADLAQPATVTITIYKIHGCLSDRDSIMAATSQLDAPEGSDHLWANPQVEAAFQGRSIVFVGYSGSLSKIKTSMAKVARWSPEFRHYAVDHCDWQTFSNRASEFVTSANMTDERFFACGAEEFVTSLVDRVLRYRVLELINRRGDHELGELRDLASEPEAEAFQLNEDFAEAIAGADRSEAFLRALLRKIDRYPLIRSNERFIARVAAWVSYLSVRGWQLVHGLPIIEKDDRRVYFAGDSVGVPARKLVNHVRMTLDSESDLRRTVSGDNESLHLTCVLLLASGTVGEAMGRDFVTAAPDRDILYSRKDDYHFLTEQEFLDEIRAA